MTSPRDQASAFRVRHGLGDAPIRDMFQVVEDFTGAFVLSRKFPASQEAFTVHDEDSGMTIIAVGTSDNYERQRFSVAHELGHLESGRMSADVHSLPDFTSSKDETWAHDFARHLLLPLGAVQKYLTNLGRSPLNVTIESLSDLVRVFGVSPRVAMIQLRDSKWISKRDFEEWSKRLQSLTSRGLAMEFGWASERDGLVQTSLSPRRPTRVVRAATAAYQRGEISLESLAQVWGVQDLAAFQTTLENSEIRPPTTTGENSERETEDLSDLYRASP